MRFWQRKKREAELEEEVRSHLEMATREHGEKGEEQREAERAARREFGNVGLVKEATRDAWGWRWLENLWEDLRYGLRTLSRSPGFTAVAVLTLALGIGVNTAMFSIVNAIFLRPLPFPHADRLYVVDRTGNRIGGSSLSFPMFLSWQREASLFEHLALFGWHGPSTLTGAGEPEKIPTSGVTTDFFPMIGIHPALGRDFRTEEGHVGGLRVAMLSDRFWRSHFGGNTSIVGKEIVIDGEPNAIVGVLPGGFELPIPGARNSDLWLPIQVPAVSHDPSNGGLLCIGLLKPGASPEQAAAALTPPLAELRREYPQMFSPNERAHLDPFRNFLAARAGPAPLLLLGAVGLVLLIACANIANLLLARSTVRRGEIAMRTALGASRGRIVRQLLTESVLLALIGGTLGVIACYGSFSLILSLVPANISHVGAFRIDGTVLAFSALASLAAGVLFGLVPAIGASRVNPGTILKEASAQGGMGSMGIWRRALAASEIATSLVLLIGAALALESFGSLLRVHPGFDPGNLLTFHVAIPNKKYATPAARSAFFEQTLARMSAFPGADEAGIVNVLPFGGGPDLLFSIVGQPDSAAPDSNLDADYRVISPNYFRALRIPLVGGRIFDGSDNAGSEPVVVINQSMAKMFWPNQDPIGQRIWIGKPMGPSEAEPSPRQIIGIVGDIRERSLAFLPEPTTYIPITQVPHTDEAFFVLRTRQAPQLSFADARSAVHAMDADIPLVEAKTMDEVVSGSTENWRFHAILLGAFGTLALFIAAIGVYGVISYSLAQRTHEIGIRMALGAHPRDVLRIVIGQGMKIALVGVAIGLLGALALTRLMVSLLFGVNAVDPPTYAGVTILLLLVALIATYLPARRAMRVDPMVALRYE